MARPLRIEFEHALYHVTSRGDQQEDIYSSDEDRLAWLNVLAQVCKRFNWQVYAYCLMSNHYHLLVQTPDANLSSGMRQLNGVYTQRSNKTHGRSGHVFQGRFKAILVDADSYLLELARYIVLNPVRAGLGLPSVWKNLQSQMYLGDEKFIASMMRKFDASQQTKPSAQWQEIPALQRNETKKPLTYFETQHPNERNRAIQAAYQSGHYSMQTIAQHFGLYYTSVSRILKGV